MDVFFAWSTLGDRPLSGRDNFWAMSMPLRAGLKVLLHCLRVSLLSRRCPLREVQGRVSAVFGLGIVWNIGPLHVIADALKAALCGS
jgi:hypothetical protein